MFIQVISGTVKDLDGMVAATDRWQEELRPGATGYLGATSGVTDDNRFVTLVRFDNEANATANSERPEQGKWWSDFEKNISDATFHNANRVETLFGGGNDDATFIQVMRGRIKDQAKADTVFGSASEAEKMLSKVRPDVIGEIVAIHDDGDGYTDVVYFTSEAEARANESKPMPEEAQSMMAEMDAALEVTEYLDLKRVWLR
jgi:hypothetical protein